jgi:diguanylate cyclase (GGDEF)-like protein
MSTGFAIAQYESEPDTRPISVLVVDDEPAVVQMVSRYLDNAGYSVETATDGRQALEKIRAHVPDAVLLDIKMPRLDGISVCRALRQDFRTRGLPVIFITAQMALSDRLHGYQSGADDYVVKPFDLAELKVRIEGALRRKRWDQWAHPLTGLPGSPGIEEEVRRRVLRSATFAFAYLDIDYFKSYNDAYGYDAGDRMIKMLAKSLVDSSVAEDMLMGFPAHIGGDDFALIAPPEAMAFILKNVTDQFDAQRDSYYSPDDLERHSVRSMGRTGKEQEFPLVTLSVAVVSTQTRHITHYARLAEIVSELKNYTKQQPHNGKSLVVWDRRKDVKST